jgi:hypothetical protein
MAFARSIGLILSLMIMATQASAHRENESYVYFNVTDDALSGRVEATLTDLDLVLPLDADGNGEVTQEEFLARSAEAYQFFADRLTISHEGASYPTESTGFDFLETPLGVFALINFNVVGLSPTPEAIDVEYSSPISDAAPGHLGYGLIESNTKTGITDNESNIALIFEPGAGPQKLSLIGDPPLKVFKDFVVHGVWHIWLGFDHVLFLITLLLPAVLIRKSGEWLAVGSFKQGAIAVIKLATVFTLAHSVTLSLAALGIVQLPVRLVETVIAASIAVVALNNTFPAFHHKNLWIVFAFGLFHGFGFANVLAPLGVNPSAKVVGLAAFNIGVEIGQIAIIAVVFPVLFMLRRWSAYPFLALRMASVFAIVMSVIWLIERNSGFFWRLQQQLLGA